MTDILVQTSPQITTDALIAKVEQLSSEQRLEVLKLIESLLQQNQPRKTIWDKIEERIAKLPEDVISELPVDSSENLDHYLYGVPKE